MAIHTREAYRAIHTREAYWAICTLCTPYGIPGYMHPMYTLWYTHHGAVLHPRVYPPWCPYYTLRYTLFGRNRENEAQSPPCSPVCNVDNEARRRARLWEKRGRKEEGMRRREVSFLPVLCSLSVSFCSFPLPVPVRNPGKSPMVLNIPRRNVKKDEKRENVRKVTKR